MWKRYRFTTTEEFLRLLDEHKGRKELNVMFSDSRNVYKPKKIINRVMQVPLGDEYYVLRHESNTAAVYLCKLTKTRLTHCPYPNAGSTKKFTSEAQATKWLARHKDKMCGLFDFAVVKHSINA